MTEESEILVASGKYKTPELQEARSQNSGKAAFLARGAGPLREGNEERSDEFSS